MLCTGCEMDGMDVCHERVCKMIDAVREVYHGMIMHNINHDDEFKYPWLSKVDVIGVSAYYRLTDGDDVSLGRMLRSWDDIRVRLIRMHEKYKRPIMFAEIGVRNEHGCSKYPYDFHHREEVPLDEDEQADFYQSALHTFWDEDWFSGYFWWDWKVKLPPSAQIHKNRDFTIYGKKAERILSSWYLTK